MSGLRFLTAGESHGPGLVAIVDGMPAGVPLTVEDLAHDLARRQVGYGRGGRMAIERDAAEVFGGVLDGQTTGAPVALLVRNRDWENWRDREWPRLSVPRPGHADLAGYMKHELDDCRPVLERASARETAARVAAGAVARALLRRCGVAVGSYVERIGGAGMPATEPDWSLAEAAEASDVRCPDADSADAMRAAIDAARQAGDSVGGVFVVLATGLPPGLGSHAQWDRRLDGRLAQALLSVQAVKGVEVGPAFADAALPGTQVHDAIVANEETGRQGDAETLRRGEGPANALSWSPCLRVTASTPLRVSDAARLRPTNRAGGLEGGMTTGQPLVLRAAMKPIPTTITAQESLDLDTGQSASTQYQRSDVCAVPAASVVAEAMVCLVLADALLDKFGGDSLAALQASLARYLAQPLIGRRTAGEEPA